LQNRPFVEIVIVETWASAAGGRGLSGISTWYH